MEVYAMRLWSWLKGCYSTRGKALSHYRHGILLARKHDHPRAIDEYTAVIDMANAPRDVRAMALYNRALVHAASQHEAQAADDLRAVLAGDESPTNVKSAARQKLLRLSRQHRSEIV